MIDLTGQQFGRLIVVDKIGKDKHGHYKWLCKCSCKCKRKIILQSSHLITCHTKSCGCLRKEISIKHGHIK